MTVSHPDPDRLPNPLADLVGEMDIYLLDQVLRGRITPDMRLLDAGCGSGRNLFYFLRHGYQVAGVDHNVEGVDAARRMAILHAPDTPADAFRVESLTDLSFDDASFDIVICNAVLHFAESEQHFHAMMSELWRVLQPGGMFFARLASTVGIEAVVEHREGRWYHLPDGTDRFLVDEKFLVDTTEMLGGSLLDPIKTVNVQNLRCMTTWCVRKNT